MSITIRPSAAADIDAIADYLEQQREGYGFRFQDAVAATTKQMERHPGLGSLASVSIAALEGLRLRPIRRFKNHLVFYLPRADGIEVIRVLHGARDLPHILEQSGT